MGDKLLGTSAVIYKRTDDYGGTPVVHDMEVVHLDVPGEVSDCVLCVREHCKCSG